MNQIQIARNEEIDVTTTTVTDWPAEEVLEDSKLQAPVDVPRNSLDDDDDEWEDDDDLDDDDDAGSTDGGSTSVTAIPKAGKPKDDGGMEPQPS